MIHFIFNHLETFIVGDHHAGHVVLGPGHAVSLFVDFDCTIADGICLENLVRGDCDYLVDHDMSLVEDCADEEADLMAGPFALSLCACRRPSRRNRRPPLLDRIRCLGTGVSARGLRHLRSRLAVCAW